MLKDNKIEKPSINTFSEDEVRNVLKQRPNHKTLRIRLKLRVFNTIDSTKTAKDQRERYLKYRKKNKRRLERQERINERRIERALRKGKVNYRPKDVKLKDTVNPKSTWRERLKYDFGEPPKIFDSTAMNTSQEQLDLFLQKKGYFDGEVKTKVNYKDRRQMAEVTYELIPGKAYIVDSLSIETENQIVRNEVEQFMQESDDALHVPFRFDTDELGEMRNALSEYMRNNSLYGFKASYVNYVADTIGRDSTVHISLEVAPRTKGGKEGQELNPFAYTKVKKVYFHLQDTLNYEGNFYANELKPRGIKLKAYDEIPTFDTLVYDDYSGPNEQFRTATFYYNGELTLKAKLLEFENYLEENNYYKGKFLNQSYNRLAQLNIFKTIRPKIVENDDNTIDVHYYLTQAKKQTFSFEPRGTHSNSFLGVSASLNYTNRNIRNSGKQLKISFSGGFESQPQVFSDNSENEVIDQGSRSFNTLELGPTISLDIPGLMPIPLNLLTKRQNPKTTISLAYNYQERPDFTRRTGQFNYLWKFYDVYRTQVFTIGIPVVGGIQYVNIGKSQAFQDRLEEQNDLFLKNAYSNQTIWKDLQVTYQWTNQENRKGNVMLSYGANFDLAGMVLSLFTQNQPLNDDGFKEFLGQRFSQFIRLDNEIRIHHYLEGDHSINYRIQFGGGVPLSNNGLNLPFDYSFFAGGSNDNRGFRARSLGPGAYKYYLDTNRTVTEIGDIRLGGSVEYRFRISDLLEGALFSDVGNIWNFNQDDNRPGGRISEDFYKQISVSGGVGLRLDFTFLILRLDLGIPLRNPALPSGAKWIFQSREPVYQEGIDEWGINPATNDYYYKSLLPNVFQPQFHIGIGYPF
jgi:outer membrane translocation and assembly module TamA